MAETPEDLDERALRVLCPDCDAAAGEPCAYPNGRKKRRPHAVRRDGAAAPDVTMHEGLTDADGWDGVAPSALIVPLGAGTSRGARYMELRLTPRQSRGLRALFDGVEGRTVTEGGRVVRKQVHALRWLLERLADMAESGTDEVEVRRG